MKTYVRVDVGPDGFGSGVTTLHDTSSVYSILSLSYPKNFGEAISTVTIRFNRNVTTADDTILGPGKEIRIWHKTSSPVGNLDADRIFRGYVIDKKLEGNEVVVTANDLFIKAQWTTGTTTQDYETSTSVKTILTALCTAAGLTASNNAATPSPANVEKFYSNQQNVFERIQYLLNLTGWYGYYDPTTTQTIVFQPKSAGGSQTFNATNIIGVPQWSNDSRDLINDVTIIGGSNNILNATVTFTGDGGIIYTDFGLPYPNVILENVSVTQGTDWPTDEFKMIAGSTAATTGIIFTKGTEPASGTVTVTYTYQTASVTSTATNATSQSNYVSRSKPIQKRDVLNSTDATSWANNLVDNSFWGLPIQEVTILVNENVIFPILGSKADVIDPINARALTYLSNNTIVYSIELQWPYPGIKTFISSRPLKNPMQQTSVQDSVEKVQLELKKINPTSLLRKDATTPIGGSQDMGGFQVRNLVLENSTVAPVSLETGGLYFDTSAGAGKGIFKINTGTSGSPVWTIIAMGALGYLPLTAGSGEALTGDLYMTNSGYTTSLRNNAGSIELHIGAGHTVKIVRD